MITAAQSDVAATIQMGIIAAALVAWAVVRRWRPKP